MKTIFKAALASAAALCLLSSCKTITGAPEVKPLHVEGTQLYAGNEPVQFNGISYGWHNIWPRFYNQSSVKQLHDEWGCRIFRAAIGADDHAKADNPGINGGYTSEPEFALECAYELIDGAIACGSYVIVDWHSHSIHLEEAKKFFSAIATKYKGCPNIIYELFNEPVCFSFENGSENPYEDLGDPDRMNEYWRALKSYASELISTITAIDDSKPVILMGCPSWDQRIDLPASSPVEGYDNLMYTVHFYAATHGQWLRDATDAALEAGIPVFISECAGCEATGDGYLDREAWKTYSDWAKERGISMMAWSISDKVETCSMFTSEAPSEGPWENTVIKEWGKLVRDWVKNNE